MTPPQRDNWVGKKMILLIKKRCRAKNDMSEVKMMQRVGENFSTKFRWYGGSKKLIQGVNLRKMS